MRLSKSSTIRFEARRTKFVFILLSSFSHFIKLYVTRFILITPKHLTQTGIQRCHKHKTLGVWTVGPSIVMIKVESMPPLLLNKETLKEANN
jgi:hypothetical protein